MKQNHKITPEGTHDLLFEECLARREAERRLTEAFRVRGYHEVMTPGFEYYDVFTQSEAGIGQEVMYKMTDRHGRLIVMRPDSTMPIARLAATRLLNQPRPLRLYYDQPVYRSNPALIGREDENAQAGVELLGADGLRADLEVLTTAVESLFSCVPDFRLELGHAGFFHALAEQLSLSEDCLEDIRSAIESKNYAALDQILDALPASAAVDAMRRLPRLFGGEEVFEEAEKLCETPKAKETLSYLKKLYHAVQDLGLGDRLMVDLGLVQRNNYYTGVVFTAYTEEYGDAVLFGGRYDHLLEHYGCKMPAVGFGVNVDAVTKILLQNDEYPAVQEPQVLVHGDHGQAVAALRRAAKLTAQGICCETSLCETREEALNYAKSRNIPKVEFVEGKE